MRTSAISQKNKGELTKEQVSAVYRPRAEETTDGCQVNQPTEHGGGTAGDGHEGEEREERLSIHSLS